MASSRKIKTVPEASRDFISQLPADVKDRILECLPTREAARIALLSTQWRDVWLGHGQLVFDLNFFRGVRNGAGDKRIDFMKIIIYILLHRARPIKKFVLDINIDPILEQSDLDQWILFLSRNGIEELNISSYFPRHEYKLPSCIVLCRTIKQLVLGGLIFDWPTNAPCIFPCVTSLLFEGVVFTDNVNGTVSSIPNLEKLDFIGCREISNFEISAPKLESLFDCGLRGAVVECRWFIPCLKALKTLCLYSNSFSGKDAEVVALTFPTAINLQVIKLYDLCFGYGNQLTFAMQLLKKSPNLCELEIKASNFRCSSKEVKVASRLLRDSDSCMINHDLKMLNTVKIDLFSGSTVEMLFVKVLLSKSPTLERVVIEEGHDMDAFMAVKIRRKLLRFPLASTKVKMVYMDRKATYNLVG